MAVPLTRYLPARRHPHAKHPASPTGEADYRRPLFWNPPLPVRLTGANVPAAADGSLSAKRPEDPVRTQKNGRSLEPKEWPCTRPAFLIPSAAGRIPSGFPGFAPPGCPGFAFVEDMCCWLPYRRPPGGTLAFWKQFECSSTSRFARTTPGDGAEDGAEDGTKDLHPRNPRYGVDTHGTKNLHRETAPDSLTSRPS